MKPRAAGYCLSTPGTVDVCGPVCLTVSYSLGWNWKSCALWNTGFSCMNNCWLNSCMIWKVRQMRESLIQGRKIHFEPLTLISLFFFFYLQHLGYQHHIYFFRNIKIKTWFVTPVASYSLWRICPTRTGRCCVSLERLPAQCDRALPNSLSRARKSCHPRPEQRQKDGKWGPPELHWTI